MPLKNILPHDIMQHIAELLNQADLGIGDLIPVLRTLGDVFGNARRGKPEGGDISIYKAKWLLEKTHTTELKKCVSPFWTFCVTLAQMRITTSCRT
jgi:hypothetical protein